MRESQMQVGCINFGPATSGYCSASATVSSAPQASNSKKVTDEKEKLHQLVQSINREFMEMTLAKIKLAKENDVDSATINAISECVRLISVYCGWFNPFKDYSK